MSPADRSLTVTIDGPAASGKSSTARMVAEALGARHLDSGALYRGVTAARIRSGGEPDGWTERSVLEAAERVTLAPGATTFVAHVDGAPCEDELRGDAVTALVSLVAKMPHVRQWVNRTLQATAAQHAVVADGRDMGTTVFPEATLKVWLVAIASERARRRVLQRTGRAPTAAEMASETADLEARDRKDSEQTRPAADAVWLDTSGITQPEQVAQVVAWARERQKA